MKTLFVCFKSKRKFGLELEFTESSCELRKLKNTIGQVDNNVEIYEGYTHNHNNANWVCKTDSSCGIEVCTKVMSGNSDITLVGTVLKKIKEDLDFHISERCGQHVHIDVSDFSSEQLQILVAYWVKIEHLIMKATPQHRRNNQYCQQSNSMINNYADSTYDLSRLYQVVASERGALNLRNVSDKHKIEFRFGDMTYDTTVVKNRVRFLLWFVDIVKNMPAPENLNWFNLKQAMRFFGLWVENTDLIQKTFSPAIQSMKKWLCNGVINNAGNENTKDITIARELCGQMDSQEVIETE